ncbi:MAG TPA: penicillin-binding transpeptidase domain-containing protein [Mycetocola sp.]|uniref:peptidoglycan D,D-transpeptidase FtsI family protein n=1 Tax=Mycetocola sp. TaxID=1871042 RepID=UPI0026337911|nr:penicillin-binding transpeptidase domain-containing protein [Mycetocola sp.]MCU1419326.1 cell division protein FtsI [Mycetocola sp.]MCU1561439.1 cell division protein FtsI [Mycetocola sp.]HEV7848808.1 penicillin-binding transpeptidase domain-containing protein [Mycetocola sp.]
MNRELKRVSVLVLVMFFALFGSTTVIQAVQADALRLDPRNTRALYDSYDTERGPVLAGSTVIAQSVPTGDQYVFQRQYPLGEMYAPVTGYFSPNQGSAGIEQYMNDYLSGTSNSQFLDTINRIVAGQAPKGAAVEVTIDPAVQQAAFDALGDRQGAVVAIEPSTGRILAMVSTPTYDPNVLASHDSKSVISAFSALEADPLDPLSNRASSGNMNPPGSSFKVVVAAAAVESGKYTAESTFPNPVSLQLPNSSATVYNWNRLACGPGETVTLAEAIRQSCNVPLAELGMQLGDDAIRETAEKFGFNSRMTLPTPAGVSVYPKNLDDAQTGLTAFGQYEVRATPLQMALVSAGIANGGTVMEPTLVDRVTGRNLEVLKSFEPKVRNDAVSSETAASVTSMMLDSVSTGQSNGARIEGVDVAGKTGTAQNGEDEPYSLWFTGFAPASNPEVAVAVVVENDGNLGRHSSGNIVAAPIAKKVLEAVLNK